MLLHFEEAQNKCSLQQETIFYVGALDKGGVGALELVAMDMKARLELQKF